MNVDAGTCRGHCRRRACIERGILGAMTVSRGKKWSLAVFAIATVAALFFVPLKRKTALRDPSTLPHVGGEPVAPGVSAAENVIRKQLEHAPLKVRSVQLKRPYWAGFTGDGKRERTGNFEVAVELSESGVYEICGSVRDFMPAEGMGPPCPKVKHVAGDDLTLDASVDFTLDGEHGWKDPTGRHWFGDELLEIETKVPLL
jgi:hypothetical protein